MEANFSQVSSCPVVCMRHTREGRSSKSPVYPPNVPLPTRPLCWHVCTAALPNLVFESSCTSSTCLAQIWPLQQRWCTNGRGPHIALGLGGPMLRRLCLP